MDINSSQGRKVDKRGFILFNFSHKIHKGNALKDDPYILSSQANQVFYVEDEKDKGWAHVVRVNPRDNYQLGATMADEDESYPLCMPPNISKEDAFRDPINYDTVDREE